MFAGFLAFTLNVFLNRAITARADFATKQYRSLGIRFFFYSHNDTVRIM